MRSLAWQGYFFLTNSRANRSSTVQLSLTTTVLTLLMGLLKRSMYVVVAGRCGKGKTDHANAVEDEEDVDAAEDGELERNPLAWNASARRGREGPGQARASGVQMSSMESMTGLRTAYNTRSSMTVSAVRCGITG